MNVNEAIKWMRKGGVVIKEPYHLWVPRYYFRIKEKKIQFTYKGADRWYNYVSVADFKKSRKTEEFEEHNGNTRD